MAGAAWNCCCLGMFCTHHTTMHRVMSSKATYIRCMLSCNLPSALLAEWPVLLCATVVTWGWNRYWKSSQHRKLTLDKKILLPFLQGLKTTTFQSRVWRTNHWAIPVNNSNPILITGDKQISPVYGKLVILLVCTHYKWLGRGKMSQ